ncbi:MAG TPA: ATP-binding protein [Bacteroidales bacterium]|nr:ATP-binding protein [Bacteroidales bacterium]
MIIEFNIGNFRSIKDIQTFNMTAANIVSKYKEIDDTNLIKVSDKLSLLKSKGVYGANASGKSNLVRGLVAFIAIVNRSVKDEKILAEMIDPFRLSVTSENEPTYFQLSFLLDKIYYRYGFEASESKIHSEWLFGTPGKREVPFFTRINDKIEINESQFKEGASFSNLYSKGNNDIARENSLFLTTIKALNGALSKKIVDYISSITVISGLGDKRLHSIAGDSLKDEKTRALIIDLLKITDTGIDNVVRVEFTKENLPKDAPIELLSEIENNKKFSIILTEHKRYNKDLKRANTVAFLMASQESEGSKKMFEISPFIIKALETKSPIVIDEFDARFHPLLTKKLIELFNSKTNTGAQFIFITHDTNLLRANLLRRDQICFVEKDKYGGSHFYTLADFKGIRNDASFEKDYISGKYGAIPFLGDFSSIIED